MSLNEKSFTTQKAQSSRDVIAFYDQYAASWDQRFGEQPSTTEFHRIRFDSFLKLANLKPTDRAIEIGVGTGPYVDRIAPRVRELVCVDGSQGMLDALKKRHSGVTNVQVRQMDLEQPGVDVGEKADLLYCFGLVEHIIDLSVFAENCKRMLKPNGRFVIISTNGRSPWYGGMRKLWRAGQHCSTDHYYTAEELDEALGKHGFERAGVVYWGYFPAGVGNVLFRTLQTIGRLVDLTPFRKYAGGITISYRLRAAGR